MQKGLDSNAMEMNVFEEVDHFCFLEDILGS